MLTAARATLRRSPRPGARLRARRARVDAVTALTCYLVALFAVESRLGVSGLGGAGHPSFLVGGLCMGWWAYQRVQQPYSPGTGGAPVRVMLLLFGATVLASYAAAMSRPIRGPETSTVQLGLISVLCWLGVALLAHDGVPDRRRFDKLFDRVVLLGTLLATLGLAQFVTNDSLVRYLTIPGLTANVPLTELISRNGFVRPSGTALHPIEYGAVLTTVLPLAITRARVDLRRPLLLRWLPTYVIGLGIVVSISRSAMLCAIMGLVVLVTTWPPRPRRVLIVCVSGLVAFVALTIPGMLGSLTSLFVTAGEDDSVASRTGSYPIAQEFIGTAPWFGRGYSTFLPVYRIFDNQYLMILVELGIIGFTIFLGMLLTGVHTARRARLASALPADRERAQALLAALCAAGLGLAFFDGFAFTMSTGLLFVILGMAGAAHRLARAEALDGAASTAHRGVVPLSVGAPVAAPHPAASPVAARVVPSPWKVALMVVLVRALARALTIRPATALARSAGAVARRIAHAARAIGGAVGGAVTGAVGALGRRLRRPRTRRPAVATAILTAATVVAVIAVTGDLGPGPDDAPAVREAPAAAGPERVRTRTLVEAASERPRKRRWPSAANTGPRGKLRETGGRTVNADGQVLKNLHVRGTLRIEGDNVVIRNVRVTTAGFYGILVYGKNVLIENTEVRGTPGPTLAGIAAYENGSVHVVRTEVHGSEDGVRLNDHSSLRRSYVHGLAGDSGAHYDAVTADGAVGWRIVGNRIVNRHPQTAAVWIGDPRYGPSSGVLKDNILGGGGYTIYAGHSTGRGLRVIGNRFLTRIYPRSGYFGIVHSWRAANNEWKGNVWRDGPRRGQVVRPW